MSGNFEFARVRAEVAFAGAVDALRDGMRGHWTAPQDAGILETLLPRAAEDGGKAEIDGDEARRIVGGVLAVLTLAGPIPPDLCGDLWTAAADWLSALGFPDAARRVRNAAPAKQKRGKRSRWTHNERKAGMEFLRQCGYAETTAFVDAPDGREIPGGYEKLADELDRWCGRNPEQGKRLARVKGADALRRLVESIRDAGKRGEG